MFYKLSLLPQHNFCKSPTDPNLPMNNNCFGAPNNPCTRPSPTTTMAQLKCIEMY